MGIHLTYTPVVDIAWRPEYLGGGLSEHRLEKEILRAEIVVQHRLVDLGPSSDIGHTGAVKAVLMKGGLGGREDALFGVLVPWHGWP